MLDILRMISVTYRKKNEDLELKLIILITYQLNVLTKYIYV